MGGMAETATPLDRAIEAAGGMSALAEKLTARGWDVKRMTVYQWKNSTTGIPAKYCPDVELITGVKCEDLQPDVNWAVLRTTQAKWNGVDRRKQSRAA